MLKTQEKHNPGETCDTKGINAEATYYRRSTTQEGLVLPEESMPRPTTTGEARPRRDLCYQRNQCQDQLLQEKHDPGGTCATRGINAKTNYYRRSTTQEGLVLPEESMPRPTTTGEARPRRDLCYQRNQCQDQLLQEKHDPGGTCATRGINAKTNYYRRSTTQEGLVLPEESMPRPTTTGEAQPRRDLCYQRNQCQDQLLQEKHDPGGTCATRGINAKTNYYRRSTTQEGLVLPEESMPRPTTTGEARPRRDL
ncbi:uncharacterized protein LOC113377180 [Ctenocephalides felis]|uniref:uncharacterized protein LOC113377180 n=1 Tax=Ctenocephalides felis TaxID=7515 RepID=UPI000E6E3BC9|nr:uncharacterized protein LOC113377180 [Ctenocephalides felis]